MKKELSTYIRAYEDETVKETICVDAGTYYFYVYSYSEDTSTKFKVTASNVSNAANYCIAKATTLKAGATAKICQTPQYNYSRWYKIKLDKAKKVKFTTNNKSSNFIEVYNTNGKEFFTTVASNFKSATTDKKLAAGTYYVRFSEKFINENNYGLGTYFTFKWS